VSGARLSVCAIAVAVVACVAPASAWGASGGFERALGRDVVAGGGTGFEICTDAAICKSGTQGVLGGEFSFPEDVAVDSAGNTYVADPSNNRIQKLDPSGGFALAWGKDVVAGNAQSGYEVCTAAAACKAGGTGGLGGEFYLPSGVAVDSSGNVYVADYANRRIQKFDSSGNFLLAWGKHVNVFGGNSCNVASLCIAGDPGGLGGEFMNPQSVAVAPNGSVYVDDAFDHRIQAFDSSGNFQRAWGKDVVATGGTGAEICTSAATCQGGEPGALGGELSYPNSVDVGPDGSVYVADAARIQKFDASGIFQRAWGKDVVAGNGGTGFEICTVAADCRSGTWVLVSPHPGGELGPGLHVASDPSGDVYVADPVDLRIQKFDSSGNFLRTWGKDVVAGGGQGFEICTAAASCQAGASGVLGGELAGAAGLASDGAGNLTVVDGVNHRIQVFGEAVDPSPPPPPTGTTGTTGTDSQTGSTGTDTLGTQQAANPQCQVLRKKLKKANTKRAKQKIRRKLRALGCGSGS
jgi:sugar lactone lactonase YvrE